MIEYPPHRLVERDTPAFIRALALGAPCEPETLCRICGIENPLAFSPASADYCRLCRERYPAVRGS